MCTTNKLTMLAWEAFRADADSHNATRKQGIQDSKPTKHDVPDSFSQPVSLIYRKGISHGPSRR